MRPSSTMRAALLFCALAHGAPTHATASAARPIACAHSRTPHKPHAEPRLILTTGGLTTPELKQRFCNLLAQAHAERGSGPLTVAVIVTAALAVAQPPPPPQLEPPADGMPPPDPLAQRREEVAASARSLVAQAGLSSDAHVLMVDAARDERDDMEKALARSACIMVLGGNTFYLWHHMVRSGLAAIVRRRVVDDGALYVGLSAGSIVAGRSISTAFWKGWDDPTVVPDCDWTTPTAVDALGLVDCSFFPHHDESWEATVRSRSPSLGHEVVTLREEGGAFVSGAHAADAERAVRVDVDASMGVEEVQRSPKALSEHGRLDGGGGAPNVPDVALPERASVQAL